MITSIQTKLHRSQSGLEVDGYTAKGNADGSNIHSAHNEISTCEKSRLVSVTTKNEWVPISITASSSASHRIRRPRFQY